MAIIAVNRKVRVFHVEYNKEERDRHFRALDKLRYPTVSYGGSNPMENGNTQMEFAIKEERVAEYFALMGIEDKERG